MGILDILFGQPKKANPIEELDTNLPDFVCEECGVKPPTLYDVDSLLYCADCKDAEERRQRFKAEDAEWNSVDSK